MIKLSIKNESPQKESRLALELIHCGDNILVRGTDNEGQTWDIIRFLPEGMFKRIPNVGASSGLLVDGLGRVEETKY